MSVIIGVCAETQPGEKRMALVPDVIKKYIGLGAEVHIQKGAGESVSFSDEAWAATKIVASAAEIYKTADIILCVQRPDKNALASMKSGAVLIGLLQPWADKSSTEQLISQNITSFPMELLPRISRAQSMDVLSSQAAVAGYQAALIAASMAPKFFPMLTYAAGSIRPSKVLIIGAGVAGLQAIATARRIGAIVEAYDVRPETREQIESLGAKFVDTGVSAAGSGGYARELTDEEKAKQAERLAKAVAQCDALITTAAIPGKTAPKIITANMVAGMKAGAVVVDLAAETGGNVAGTVAGEVVNIAGVSVFGPVNIASRMAIHASEMLAKNLFNFISPFIKEGNLVLDWDDEVIAKSCLTHATEIKHNGVKQALGL